MSKYLFVLFFFFGLMACSSTKNDGLQSAGKTPPGQPTKAPKEVVTQMPCINEKLIDKRAVCPDESKPVCGCDNKTYKNSCEATKAGVIKYTKGACVDKSDR